MKRIFLALFLIAIAPAAWALSPVNAVQVINPWSRATAGRTAAVYVTFENNTRSDDRLVAAATAIAERAELHVASSENGVMRMRPLDAIEIKSGTQATLKPGGMHIMLIGLKQPLRAGQTFPLTLSFERSGNIEITVKVMKAGATGGEMKNMPM